MKKIIDEYRDLMQTVSPFLMTTMVLSIVGMNLLANKSIDTGLEWLALDCGILLSWMTFLSMDVMTHCYGPRAATMMCILSLLFNLLMALVFFIAGCLPGFWGESFAFESFEEINTALDNTISGTWYIIMGSSIAFLVSSIVNNFLNYGIGKSLTQKDGFGVFALRSYVSTFIGQFTDNIVFAFIVSRVFFGWTTVQCLTCALTGACLELLFEVFFSPVGYRASRAILREETK